MYNRMCAHCFKYLAADNRGYSCDGHLYCSQECARVNCQLDERAALLAACPIKVGDRVRRKRPGKYQRDNEGVVLKLFTQQHVANGKRTYRVKATVKWERVYPRFGGGWQDMQATGLVGALVKVPTCGGCGATHNLNRMGDSYICSKCDTYLQIEAAGVEATDRAWIAETRR